MSATSRALVLVLALALVLPACGRATPDASVAPEPAPATTTSEAPFETQTFVSTSRNETEGATFGGDAQTTGPIEGFAVVTPEAVKELAQAAVSDRLDPKKTWKLSPVLPAAWPSEAATAIVYFYPMAAYQSSLTRYTLFTPAFRVSVSLVDGATEVEPLGKPRALGTIEDSRPSSLERRELDMSENALVLRLVGADDHTGENPFWGYLKYIHEHPKLGRDLEKRAAGFIGWVRKKAGR